jgi:phage portal protein BeeE
MPEVKYKRDKELINRYMSTLQEMILSDNPEMRQNGIDFMREIINE